MVIQFGSRVTVIQCDAVSPVYAVIMGSCLSVFIHLHVGALGLAIRACDWLAV